MRSVDANNPTLGYTDRIFTEAEIINRFFRVPRIGFGAQQPYFKERESMNLFPNMNLPRKMPLFSLVALAALLSGEAHAQVPPAIAAPGQHPVTTLHAEGAQIYECMAGPDKKLAWQAREPIATLLLDGQTVGRHYAGPKWELADGSVVAAKVVANSPGATPNDIPWLKLEVKSQLGDGGLYGVTTVQRINTKGGLTQGPCDGAGSYQSVPYSADYVFLSNGS